MMFNIKNHIFAYVQLEKINIRNFKNYKETVLNFSPEINFLYGMNGSGKTNLLDTVYYLCMCRSYFNTQESQNIRHGENFFRLDGQFASHNDLAKDNEKNRETEFITCKIGGGRKKEFLRNKNPYQKLSEHIGLLPVVFIAPDDILLVKEGSEGRRKLLDSTLAQLDKPYLKALIEYNQILLQRNTLLKKMAEGQYFNQHLLETYDAQIAPLGDSIFEKRQQFCWELVSILQNYYAKISEQKESIQCQYRSHLNACKMAALLKNNQKNDRFLQRTSEGIHRDDLIFTINNYPLKKYGSQGQQKSFLIALKLAVYQFIKTHKQKKPLLLLDDIFDKLDENRTLQLVKIVTNKEDFGQVFISDTQLDRLQNIFNKLELNYKAFLIEKGKIKQII